MPDKKTEAKKKLANKESPKKPKEPVEVNTPPADVTPETLNAAATVLLKQLPDHAGDLVVSLSKQYSMPIWQYVTGILLAVHLEGRLSEFRLDPAWKDGLKTSELICKQCKKPFKPRHIGQPYCSNECGNLATGPREIYNVEPILSIPTTIPNPALNSANTGRSESVPTMEAA